MAQPTPYNRRFNFQDFQAQQPSSPLPGDEVDGEFNAIKLTSDQTLVNLAKIQRDDGALKNGVVTKDSLSPSLSIGFTFRGSWVSGVNYLSADGVSVGSLFYKAKSSHLSSVSNQPPNAAFWDLVADLMPLSIGENSVSTVTLQDGAVTAAKIMSNAITTDKLVDGNVTTLKLADGSVTTDKLAGASISLVKLAPITTNRVLGRNEAADGPVELLDGPGVLDLIGAPAFIRTLLNDTTALEASATLGTGERFLGETDMAGLSTVPLEGFDATYRELIFRLTDVLLASNAQNVGFRVKVGGSFRSDLNYRFSYQQRRSDGTSYVGAASEAGSAFPFTGTLSNASAANAFSGRVAIAAPGTSGSSYKGIDWKSRYFIGPSTIVNIGDGQYVGTSGPIQGIQFFTSSGNFSTGKLAMYGVL